MTNIIIQQDPRVQGKFDSYPKEIKLKLAYLRDIIITCAQEIDTISHLEETLKWGEPSYLVKKGSTIRIDWKAKTPNQYAIYFKCTSLLVSTFKTVFGDTFQYEKNRAILFEMDQSIPEQELSKCIQAALQYHHVKHLPLLGLSQT